MNTFVVINALCIFCTGLVYSMPSMVATSSQQTSESYSAMSATESSSYSASSSSSSGCSPINAALYQDAFGLASICETEAALYMNYLNKLSASEIAYFDELINLYSSQSFALDTLVTDFDKFQSEMSNIYQLLQAQSIYAANCDWATQTAVYQQVQSSLANALQYTAQGSCLYNLLNYANTNVTYLPLVAGCSYHLGNLQKQYYTASSSTTSAVSSCGVSSTTSSCTSSSTTATAPAFDTTVYQNAFGLASICEAESALYMNYLKKLSGPQIAYFDELINLYSSKSFALDTLVTDFSAFQSEMSNIYQLLQAQSIYAANCDWATQTAVYQQVQSSLANALQYTAQGSCLYNLLNFANTDLTYLPLVAGCCHHLVSLQGAYFSAASASSSYSESSSSYQASSSSSAMTESCSESAITVC